MGDFIPTGMLVSVFIGIVLIIFAIVNSEKGPRARTYQCIIEKQSLPSPDVVCEAIERSK